MLRMAVSYLSCHNASTRPFQCTFCDIAFTSKYDWARHEKSRHLRLEAWQCAPYGGARHFTPGGRICEYCSTFDPAPWHLRAHNHGICQAQMQGHVFSRKDHLLRHLKSFHKLTFMPCVDHWKVDWPEIRSRCGFCGIILPTWSDRIQHLANHFKKGKLMSDWVGDLGFDAVIAAQVINATSLNDKGLTQG